ncbi:toll/interleukin-1 receptor domain-containing protein [Acinetobacter haemolyticus]|uniref:Toll/interleukin-1 receptor domain-containing protein n=1 Tax=Acinetobacter haemolyticus TaxID=29430 RepID=A0AAW4J681_ACIHA|nr:toll/interleukin-1 receptor domain-containing protein [Acinetobacter haemolyticus]MBO3657849.1 toll/interleukin-1 receptor domain-containing protein [Acinetobacter haemolyticus]
MVNQSLKKYHLKLEAVGEGSFYKYDLDIEQLQKYIDGYHYADDILINGKTIKSALVESITLMESDKSITEYEQRAQSEIERENNELSNSGIFGLGYYGDPKSYVFNNYFTNVTDDFIVHPHGGLKRNSTVNKVKADNKGAVNFKNSNLKKIFISHATADKEIVELFIDLLEDIGLKSNQIFCSSFEGYGIPLGEDFLDRIKQELSSDVIVLFIITNNFYQSKVCLCEMGAAWALSKGHIPIVVPPLSYSDIKGVIPMTQGLLINDLPKLNSLKDKLEQDFKIEEKVGANIWERKRKKFIESLDKYI